MPGMAEAELDVQLGMAETGLAAPWKSRAAKMVISSGVRIGHQSGVIQHGWKIPELNGPCSSLIAGGVGWLGSDGIA